MNDKSSVAVIYTPNHQASIAYNAIDSIIVQTVKPERLIVVHDKSETDAISALQNRIDKVMPNPQMICIEHDPDTTFIAARNVGLNHVGDCQYIHFVNSSIQLPKDFYQKAIQTLASQQDCGVAIPAEVKLVNGLNTTIHSENVIKNPWLWLMRKKLEIAGAMLLNSHVVDKAGKFNPLLLIGADTDFFARISNQSAWCYITDCVATLSFSQTKADIQLQFPDYYRRWALIYENLLDTYKARDRMARKVYRLILAKAWLEAGQELLSHQRIEEAHDCFMRSLSWRLFNPALKYLIKIPRLRRKAHLSDTVSI